MKLLSFCVFLSLCSSLGCAQQRERRCCRYSDACPTREDCVLSDLSYPSECSVFRDSKRDKVPYNCDSESFKGSSRALSPGSFHLGSYIYSPGVQQAYPALDLHINYTQPWERARFRFMNLDGNSSSRCVDIRRNFSEPPRLPSLFLSYDCEAGFYVFERHHLVHTSGSTYQLDLCLSLQHSKEESCGSYLFTMPSISQIKSRPSLVLVEREPLLEDLRLVLHSPYNEPTKLGLFKENRQLIHEVNVSQHQILKELNSPGTYSLSYYDEPLGWMQIAQFKIHSSSYVMSSFILYLALAVCLTLIFFLLVRRFWNCRDKYSALSNDPLIKKEPGINVVIISEIDHQEHSEVLLHLSKYLQMQDEVHRVFYALDPETGITSQSNHNPWIWAQEVIGGIDARKDYIIFAASPSHESSYRLYDSLCENQTLLSTKHLSKMAEGKRVSIVDFPYSVSSSLSPLVPRDVPSIPRFSLPHQIKEFLRHIKGEDGFVFSKITGASLASKADFLDPQEAREIHSLIQRINDQSPSSSRVNNNNNEYKKKLADDASSPLVLDFSGRRPHSPQMLHLSGLRREKEEEAPMEFEVDKNIYSLKESNPDRDTSVNVEFA